MKRSFWRGKALQPVVIAASLATLAGNTVAGELLDLGTVESLKARFNRDVGKPRLLLLLSPT